MGKKRGRPKKRTQEFMEDERDCSKSISRTNSSEDPYSDPCFTPAQEMGILSAPAGPKSVPSGSSPLGTPPASVGSDINCNYEGKSLNYTEIAQQLDADSFGEVESAADPILVTVNGYRVREEFASVLGSIFLKYGDVAKNCHLKSVKSRSFQLERLCAIYLDLQKRAYVVMSTLEIQSMLVEVKDLEFVNLEVGWLSRRLQDIYIVLKKSKEYLALREKKKKNMKDLQEVQEKIRVAEEECALIAGEGKELDEAISEIKANLSTFQGIQQSLADGLL